MPGLNHVRRTRTKSAAVNVISCGVSAETLQRLEDRCAEMKVPRSLVMRDFIELCLNICDRADVVDKIYAAMKKRESA
jgi:ribosomal protein L7Ae-like RNA K-turn-binding protein